VKGGGQTRNELSFRTSWKRQRVGLRERETVGGKRVRAREREQERERGRAREGAPVRMWSAHTHTVCVCPRELEWRECVLQCVLQ